MPHHGDLGDADSDTLLQHVQLRHRDDFDITALSETFEDVACRKNNDRSYLARLQEVVAAYYPWIPAHIYNTVEQEIKECGLYTPGETVEKTHEIAWQYCYNLRECFDEWVQDDIENAEAMYLAELDIEELYANVRQRALTESDTQPNDLDAIISRAERSFIPKTRLHCVMENAQSYPNQ
ncbi:hypothetical protein [Salinibaculum rarum]|uniref:hypothetical protein n=1 Tax=Salinibaculum rarum TaxID=3058903 RepID=UPI00265F7BA8|nr:hypothetical protein [Salinibaculum sp. KK48]